MAIPAYGARDRHLIAFQNGQDDRSFVSGFRGLQRIGYTDYCSFECGCDGDREIEIHKAVKLLQAQWEEAKA